MKTATRIKSIKLYEKLILKPELSRELGISIRVIKRGDKLNDEKTTGT